MKKALALVLALVLALSMAVSASAALIELAPDAAAPATREEILVVDIDPDEDDEAQILYTRPLMPYWNYVNDEKLTDSYVTYIALADVEYKDIVLTATGILDAELVDYDPEKMEATGALNITYGVTYKGEEVAFFTNRHAEDGIEGKLLAAYIEELEDNEDLPDLVLIKNADLEEDLEDAKEDFEDQDFTDTIMVPSWWFPFYDYVEVPKEEIESAAVVPAAFLAIPATGLTYDEACAVEDFMDDYTRTDSKFSVNQEVESNIIKLTVDNNFTRAFTKGTLKIDAVRVRDKKAVSNTITVINDVTIFEYEMVKWAANNSGAALQLGDFGYSDFYTSEYGYSYYFGEEYDEEENRQDPFALVVSTTAFRAIEGKDLTLNVLDTKAAAISVTLKDIVKGQKGVNFFAWADLDVNDGDDEDVHNDKLVAASFGFMSEEVVKGAFEINVELGMDYYDLREAFGEKVEEEDIITYYVLKNGKAFDSFTVDYMTDDVTENVELTIKGENEKLGWYTLALEVPAEETEVEENPNTGAESVVGVVAALAVVSVATAAAVSLKK